MALKVMMSVHCRLCESEAFYSAYADDVARWQEGELIQNVWPDMSADMREFLISKTCPNCWEELFGGEE